MATTTAGVARSSLGGTFSAEPSAKRLDQKPIALTFYRLPPGASSPLDRLSDLGAVSLSFFFVWGTWGGRLLVYMG